MRNVLVYIAISNYMYIHVLFTGNLPLHIETMVMPLCKMLAQMHNVGFTGNYSATSHVKGLVD